MSVARRPRGRRGVPRRLLWGLALALVFAVGIALGEALHDNPQPGSTTTHERTFTLLPQVSTVTVTSP